MKLRFVSITQLIVVIGSQYLQNSWLERGNNTLSLNCLAILKQFYVYALSTLRNTKTIIF